MRALIFLSTFLFSLISFGQSSDTLWKASTFNEFKFREIGPALMSGRIADLAIHPEDDNVWFVAVGSGGVWKTTNAGVTWKSIFDGQGSYSIGCVTIDPNAPNVVWVGTGENVGGRHVGFGDGIYKSEDGGNSWTNMGLMHSEHISKIIVHPDNSDKIWVAAQGPLWSKGGQRGLYMTTDGGKSWEKTLGDMEWTGVTDLQIDPKNPDVLYAASWQRHRTIATYLGGGPESGIHKSVDGGRTWNELSNGLPSSNMGKIGLAISPHDHDVLYAAIELDRREGGVYKSTDRGATWSKQSDAVSGATGPHYYQELYACPHVFDRLYLMDNRVQISDDGGKTFRRMNEQHKHGDNHAIAFRDDDPDYILMGTDGGLYESFDLAKTWRFFDNLPLTQFYKIAVDDAEPFYNVYGGTQDNSTEGGPSRTDNFQGIQNGDWKVVLNWDGHQPATEPGNSDIMYAQRQEGTLSRLDLKSGNVTDVQPQAGEGEEAERFNWDAPILVSPHDPKTIFFASQRLWKSQNRGDSWTAISGDLTKNQNRIELPIMGRKQSFDNPWDFYAMSNYNTITSIAQSPKNAELIYIGTDDGQIQITMDGGANWRKTELRSIAGIPSQAYVNDIKADLFDENVVYMALDNHKYGDYKPYLFISKDKGKSWSKMTEGIPDRHLVWRIVQDHVNPDLLFCGTEFGIFFSPNGGKKWIQLKGGLPTISFRDIAIQRRENDLVVGSFGRSIYILDDYSALRDVSSETLASKSTLFAPRDSWWFIPKSDLGFFNEKGSQGNSHYVAKNPEYGAIFSYYIGETSASTKDSRKKNEAKLAKSLSDIPFPGYDALDKEGKEEGFKYWLEIQSKDGKTIRKMSVPSSKGFHRVAWDLKYPSLSNQSWAQGMYVLPDDFQAKLWKEENGMLESASEMVSFRLKRLLEPAIPGKPKEEVAAFWKRFEKAQAHSGVVYQRLGGVESKLEELKKAWSKTNDANAEILKTLSEIENTLDNAKMLMNGNEAKSQVGEKNLPNIGHRLFAVNRTVTLSDYGPTETAKEMMRLAEKDLGIMDKNIDTMKSGLNSVVQKIRDTGGPWILKL